MLLALLGIPFEILLLLGCLLAVAVFLTFVVLVAGWVAKKSSGTRAVRMTPGDANCPENVIALGGSRPAMTSRPRTLAVICVLAGILGVWTVIGGVVAGVFVGSGSLPRPERLTEQELKIVCGGEALWPMAFGLVMANAAVGGALAIGSVLASRLHTIGRKTLMIALALAVVVEALLIAWMFATYDTTQQYFKIVLTENDAFGQRSPNQSAGQFALWTETLVDSAMGLLKIGFCVASLLYLRSRTIRELFRGPGS